MVSEERTTKILTELRRAGWSQARNAKGSHTKWKCRTGKHLTIVPSGHRSIRAGVVRSIRQAIDNCDC